MRRWLQFVAVSSLFFPGAVSAQHSGGMSGAHAVSAGHPSGFVAPRIISRAAPHLAVRVPASSSSVRRVSSVRTHGTGIRTSRNMNVVPFGFGDTDFQDVPGLGFDYPHLAAISGSRHHHFGRFGGVFPFGSEGFFLTTPSIIVEEAQPAETQPPAAEDANASTTESDPVVRSRGHRSWGREYDAGASNDSIDGGTEPPSQDATEYVFVRRDGGLVFAVGYAWENGTLRYVTREGLRRSLARDALDLSATEQFNEQRGLRFSAPA